MLTLMKERSLIFLYWLIKMGKKSTDILMAMQTLKVKPRLAKSQSIGFTL